MIWLHLLIIMNLLMEQDDYTKRAQLLVENNTS